MLFTTNKFMLGYENANHMVKYGIWYAWTRVRTYNIQLQPILCM